MVVRGKKNGDVTFVCKITPSPKSVFLAGDFNQWSPSKQRMVRSTDGSFRATMKLPAGTYQYLFVADGKWMSDPDMSECIPNPYGSCNSVVRVM
jgi:1,4-alpha-glucan branching enzyme